MSMFELVNNQQNIKIILFLSTSELFLMYGGRHVSAENGQTSQTLFFPLNFLVLSPESMEAHFHHLTN